MQTNSVSKLILLLLMLGFFQHTCRAQQETPPDLKPVPDSLFSMQKYQRAPSAPFFYPIKELHISFRQDNQSIIAILDYHVLVKVFDSSVKQASLVGIPYYFDHNVEQVTDIRGATYNGPHQKTPLSKSKIRTINLNSRYNVKEFTMPNVKDGSVIAYSYRIKRRYIEELPDFYLANQVPTAKAKVSITYPDYLRYKADVVNFDGKVQHTVTKTDTSSIPKIFSIPQPPPLVKETWEATHIPAVKKEAYISSLADYRGKIKFQLSAFGIPRQKLENSWKYIVAEIRRNQQPLKVIDSDKKAQQLGKTIRAKTDDAVAAEDSIFKFLNTTAKFSGTKAPFSSTKDTTVLAGKPASQAAINQTLVAMLHGAGITADPVLISTRQFGRINRSFPSYFQFNGQLVHSTIGNHSYLMDASFRHSQPDLISIDSYNQTGLLLGEHDFHWISLNPSKSIFGLHIHVKAQLDRQGNLSGTIVSENTGYPAHLIRQKKANGKPISDIIRSALFDAYDPQNLTQTDMQLDHLDNYHQPVQLTTHFTLKNYATSFSDGLQYHPLVVGGLQHNPFSPGQRNLPVTLDAPEKLDLIYDLKLPRGYHLKQGKQNRSLSLPGASFKEEYDVGKGKVHYEFHINISRKRFQPDLYPQLLHLYQRWVKLSNSYWLIRP